MNIVVLQENLIKCSSFAGRVLPTKTTAIPALNHFFVSAKKGEIKLSAGDLENSISVSVPGKIEKEGECLIPAKTLLAFLPSLSGEKITIEGDDKNILIQGKEAEIRLKTEPVKEYPLKSHGEEKETTKLSRETLQNIVSKVCISVSHDESRPYLGGVLLEEKEDILYAVATDGFRLSLYKKELHEKSGIPRMIIPSRALIDLLYAVKDSDKAEVKMLGFEKDGFIGFVHTNIRYVARLLEGQFPDYQKIVPQKGTTKISVSREALHKAIKLASVFARETSNIVKIKTQKDTIIVSANAPQTGENKTQIEAKNTGEELEIAFNYRFLLDVVNTGADDEISIEANGPLNPGVFTFPKDPTFVYVVMPVRLQGAQ